MVEHLIILRPFIRLILFTPSKLEIGGFAGNVWLLGKDGMRLSKKLSVCLNNDPVSCKHREDIVGIDLYS